MIFLYEDFDLVYVVDMFFDEIFSVFFVDYGCS